MSKLKDLARAIGLGRLAHHAWRRPAGQLRNLIADGGPLERRRTERGRVAMEEAAATLTRPPDYGPGPLPVHLLTGAGSGIRRRSVFGRSRGRPKGPWRPRSTTTARWAHRCGSSWGALPLNPLRGAGGDPSGRLDTFLPADRFPVLRERWLHYPHIRKIIDPHVGSDGWKLVLDSDLLFFRRPEELLRQVDHPEFLLHAVDCATSYGYSRGLLDRLAGRPVPELVNVGLTGMRGSEIDWERMEVWSRELIRLEGASYYLEQALVALHVAGRPCAILPAADYLTFPKPPESQACRAVMHHYVAGSKRWYFQNNWRRALKGFP